MWTRYRPVAQRCAAAQPAEFVAEILRDDPFVSPTGNDENDADNLAAAIRRLEQRREPMSDDERRMGMRHMVRQVFGMVAVIALLAGACNRTGR